MSLFSPLLSVFRGLRIWLLRTILFVLVLVASGLGGLYLVCSFKGDILCSIVERQLNQATSSIWHLQGTVKPSLFPKPSIAFANVSLTSSAYGEEKAPVFSAKNLQVQPDMLALLQGRWRIGSVHLISPRVLLREQRQVELVEDNGSLVAEQPTTMDSAEHKGKDVAVEQPLADNAGSELPSARQPVNSETENNAGVVDLEDSSITLAGEINTTARMEEIFVSIRETIRDIRKRFGSFIVEDGELYVLDATGASEFSITGLDLDIRSRFGKKSRFSAFLDMGFADMTLDVSGFFLTPWGQREIDLQGEISAEVVLLLQDIPPLPILINTPFTWKGNIVEAPQLHISSQGDDVTVIASYDSLTDELFGTLQLEHLSLPRWFNFARNFPPGLQQPLNSLTGTGSFRVTPNSAYVENLEASAQGLVVRGSVGTDSFSSPVVVVDLDLEPTDLDKIFPFLATSEKGVVEPEEPTFPIPALIPLPGPADDDLPDVGYNVTVRMSEGELHSMRGGPLLVRVYPLEKDDITRVAFTCDVLAEGEVSGYLDIGHKSVVMRYDLKGVNIAHLPENIGSSVLFGGYVSGRADLVVDVTDGHWSDTWGLNFTANAEELRLTTTRQGWFVASRNVAAEGIGKVHTLRKNGLKLEGTWKLDKKGIYSSWFLDGDDALFTTLKGTLAWPAEGHSASGLYHVFGDLASAGVFTVPLGSQNIPVRGKLAGKMDWRLDTELLKFSSLVYDGPGTRVTGTLALDTAKAETHVTGEYVFTTNVETLLTDWKLLPQAIKVPKELKGKGKLNGVGEKTTFQQLDMHMDGQPIRGTFSVTGSGKGETARSLLAMDFTSNFIDLDKYIIPATAEELAKTPATTPWDLSFMKGIDMTAKVYMQKSRFWKADFNDTNVTLSLNKGKMSFLMLSSSLYGGKGTINFEGTLDANKSVFDASKFLIVIKGASLGQALMDLSGEGVYGGVADLVFDLHGSMKCSYDFPAALSGKWSIEVRDGIYPAFLGSSTAGLRNTFRQASASGEMTAGVMKSDSFILTGAMVDMKGKGWADLGKKKLDLNVSVAMAGVPTVPVRFTGPFSNMEMHMSGSRLAIGAAGAAGGSIFYLFKGILELPARAVRGIGSAISPSHNEVEGVTYQPINQ